MSKNKEITNLPCPASGSLSLYLAQIKISNARCGGRIYACKKLKDRGNLKAAHKLVTSHLRLVAK